LNTESLIHNYEKQLMKLIRAQEKGLSRIFSSFARRSSVILARYNDPGNVRNVWIRNKQNEKDLMRELKILQENITKYLIAQGEASWNLASDKTDVIVKDYIKGLSISEAAREGIFSRNLDALKTFQNRRVGNMNLSDRVWKIMQETKSQFELYLQSGISSGRSASAITRDVKQMLQEPDALYRRVRDKKTGKLVESRPMRNYHPGTGKYKSAYKNALRMTRTETNMAYRYADQARWNKLDFITGYEVKLSGSHPEYDICDEMAGEYPKNFSFGGWHPNCYDAETEVLTVDRGWQLFKDVEFGERIYSLNTQTRNLEVAICIDKQQHNFNGEMIRFHNRSLDLQVTPDHRMVYIGKNTTEIRMNKLAKDYDKNKGGLYRSCNWTGETTQMIKVGKYQILSSLLAEFMGYWLSDGSYSRKYAFSIAQAVDNDVVTRGKIRECLKEMPFDYHERNFGFEMYDRNMFQYLIKFGRSHEKYVPEFIKTSNKDIIYEFLNAFISCDGHIRKNKPFIGSHGNMFIPKSDSRTYFTSSKQIASDIGELILKLGKRPSYTKRDDMGEHNFPNGIYKINHILWVISECNSQTATVFEKNYVEYSGKVYDITIDKNHTLYVRRNGKCVWSSNCYCYTVPVMLSQDQFVNYLDSGKVPEGLKVKGVPPSGVRYVRDHSPALSKVENKPYWLDNFTYKKGAYYPKQVIEKPPTIKGEIIKNK